MCFRAGREEALESLRKLELKHPDPPEPPGCIATCLLQFREFDEASKKLTHAAALAGNGENATLLLRSADALKQAKKYEDARDLVLQKLLHKNVVSSVRLEALRLLYEILKLLDEKHEAFAVAEYALRQNPGDDTLRFTLGLDYLNGAPNELAIRHFQSLVRSNPKESGAFHNLALAYSKCSLPIKSVVHYKSAIELGGTSAAANLAYKYLECGMAQEAKELLDKAFQVADHSQRVEEALADISKRQQDEERKLESTSDAAASQRDFLTLMGNGLLSSMTPLVEGIWHFPSVELHITVADGLVRGKGRSEVEERGLGTLLLGLSSLKTEAGPEKRIEDYALRGSLRGRVCTFELTIESRSASRQLSAMGRSPIAKSGHIVFEQDGLSATVSEVVNNKFERPYRITKARPTS